MNPVVTPVGDNLVRYDLTDEDRKKLEEIHLIKGDGDGVQIAFHRMCVMQAVSALTTQVGELPSPEEARKLVARMRVLKRKIGTKWWKHADPEVAEYNRLLKSLDHSYSDTPICVSLAITQAMIKLNDRRLSAAQRQQLKELVEDILNTCPVRRTTTRESKNGEVRIIEKRSETIEYRKAEKARKDILRPIFKGTGVKGRNLPFEDSMQLIRQAAALYKTS